MNQPKRGRPPKPGGPMSKAEYQRRYREKKKAEGKKLGNAFYMDTETAELISLLSDVLDRPKAEILRLTFLRGLMQVAGVPDGEDLDCIKPVLLQMRDRDQLPPKDKAALDDVVETYRTSYDLSMRILGVKSDAR